MGNVRLYGSTSGYTELAPPAVAPDGVLSLPSGVGTLLTAEGGKVLQVVRASDATQRSTTSASFVDVTGMSITITPQKPTSVVLIIASYLANRSSNYFVAQITDSSNFALSGSERAQFGAATANPEFGLTTIIGYATPATLSAVTYKLRFRVDGGGTAYIRGELNTSQLYAIEVSA